ncbi:FMN-dependent NADH-azoreductase [Azospirillum brasilense]|uniref:FMN dependent NADH:quinone oxidoreductase n=1 Tax=Azospirillum brasilense TaxID=192 RepID=A0A560C0P1_AZOBR|nr:NAD(P)H-dependent oxidoreductase [Azospirillum brasilense]TWA78440.1 FMN-dependent NADH-azoreductase [Azospirillum brasilense]
MKILQINSSARSTGAASTRIADSLAARLAGRYPGATLDVLDLAREPVAALDDVAVAARMAAPDVRTPEQAARAAQDDALIRQFLAADVIVIGAPMYNFNISAHLKNWIDAIVRPGVTFRYTEVGPVGLVSGKTVHIALTRGGVYRGTPADIPVQYLTQVFAFIGITDVRFVYAEGMSRGPDMVDKAFRDADAQIAQLVA